MGRLVKLSKPSKLKNLVSNIKEQLRLDHVQVALSKDGIEHDIKTIAICAGSGGGVLKELKQIYITLVNYRIMKHCFQRIRIFSDLLQSFKLRKSILKSNSRTIEE